MPVLASRSPPSVCSRSPLARPLVISLIGCLSFAGIARHTDWPAFITATDLLCRSLLGGDRGGNNAALVCLGSQHENWSVGACGAGALSPVAWGFSLWRRLGRKRRGTGRSGDQNRPHLDRSLR